MLRRKRRLPVVFALLFISTSSFAQIIKGNWLVGGVINYASTNYNSTVYGPPHTTYYLQISPNVGYFFVDKLAGGLRVGISKTGEKARSQSSSDFNIGPYFRYYLLNPEKQVNVLTEAAYLYGFVTGTASEKAFKNTFSFSAGPVIYFNNVVGLEMLVSYSTYKFSKINGSNNTVRFGVGLQVHLEKEK